MIARPNLTACLRCRSRKKKCDQKLPTCRSCYRAGIECIGYDAVTKREVSRSYIHDLEQRNAALESRIAQYGVGGSDSGAINFEGETSSVNAITIPHAVTEQDIGGVGSSPQSDRLTANDSARIRPREIMATVAPLLDRSSVDTQFAKVLLAELRHTQSRTHTSRPGQKASSIETEHIALQIRQELFSSPTSLPDIKVADKITTIYFEFANFSAPLLHEVTFRRMLDIAYQSHEIQFAANHESAEPQFFCFMVFAVALLLLQKHDAGGVPTTLCERYHETAMKFIELNGLPAGVEGVQALLLLSQYSFFHPEALDTWKIVGSALRLAVELGLHEDVVGQTLDPLTIDTRRRTFWVAYSMDRTLGTVLQKPFGLSDGAINVQFPSAVDDSFITTAGIESRQPAGRKVFGIHYMKYRQLQSEMYTMLHESHANMSPLATFDSVAWQHTMHRKLDEWMSSAPNPPTLSSSKIAPPEVLQLAYYQALILLYQPSRSIPDPSDACLVTLAVSAQHYIAISRKVQRENKLRLFWLAISNQFAAGTALLHCYTHSAQVRNCMSLLQLEAEVHACSAMMWAMTERFPSARSKRDAFDIISTAVLNSLAETNANSKPMTTMLDCVVPMSTDLNTTTLEEPLPAHGATQGSNPLTAEQATMNAGNETSVGNGLYSSWLDQDPVSWEVNLESFSGQDYTDSSPIWQTLV